jgi:type I restriction enzyme S subunit
VAVNQGMIAMICDGELPNYYVLQWARTNMSTIEGRANGTTFPEITKTNFRPIPVVVPPRAVLEQFVDQAKGAYQMMVNNLRQSQALAAIRDTLLPRLISGLLDVSGISDEILNLSWFREPASAAMAAVVRWRRCG